VTRWWQFLRRGKWDAERSQELASYLDIETDQNIARGMSPEEARRAALLKLGKEGMVGVSIVLREPTAPYAAVVRADGHAGRLDAKDLLSEVDRSPAFQHTLLEYAASVFVQISQAANCVSAHNTLQRLCRWLLSVDDHLQTGAIEISQDDLGLVLGVTRPVVARAMFELQKADAIWFARGRLLLRNRARLEASACECYSAAGSGPRPSTRRTSSHLA
jgi:CRP-like cAMP-binding protein